MKVKVVEISEKDFKIKGSEVYYLLGLYPMCELCNKTIEACPWYVTPPEFYSFKRVYVTCSSACSEKLVEKLIKQVRGREYNV